MVKRKNIISMGDSASEFEEEDGQIEPSRSPETTRFVATRQSAPAFTAAERPQRQAAAKAASELSLRSEEEEDELGSDAADDMDVDGEAFIDDNEEDELDEPQSEEDYDDDDAPRSKPAKLKAGDKKTAKPAAVRKLQNQSRRASGGSKAKKGKAKADDMDLDDDDEEPEDDEDDFETQSNVSEGSSNIARMTARQRGAALGNDALGEDALVSLPLDAPRSRDKFGGDTVKKTAAQKRRKAQADAKLETEKAETINRLLNRQKGVPGRRGRKPKNAPPDEIGPDGAIKPAPVVVKQEKKPAPPAPPTQLRYIQTATQTVLHVPADLASLYVAQPPRPYPGPRPPPPTRRLVQA